MWPMIRRRASRALIALVMVVVVTGTVSAAPRTGEITDDDDGRAIAAAAAERFSDYGVATDASDLTVTRYGDGSIVVAPKGTEILTASRDPQTGFVGASVLTPDFSAGATGSTAPRGIRAAPAAERDGEASPTTTAPYWSWWASQCFARLDSVYGWMDTCYHMLKLINDGSYTYDWFDLHMFSTFVSKYPYALRDAYVESGPSGSITQYWHDWSPRSDTSRSCSTVTLSVSAAGASLGFSHEQCETWDITKYAAAGRFRNTWLKGYFYPSPGTEREVAFQIVSKVGQNKVVQWWLGWGFYVDRIPGH